MGNNACLTPSKCVCCCWICKELDKCMEKYDRVKNATLTWCPVFQMKSVLCHAVVRQYCTSFPLWDDNVESKVETN